ncbi:MAG TPA: helix-turn-helix domain-containing protein [Nitrospira sp.]|nr:helix-turn-helix domain-containing protein [Nitrospira sp.]
METRTRLILATELATHGLSICAIARQLDRHREMVGLWLKAIRIEGLVAFLGAMPRPRRGHV